MLICGWGRSKLFVLWVSHVAKDVEGELLSLVVVDITELASLSRNAMGLEIQTTYIQSIMYLIKHVKHSGLGIMFPEKLKKKKKLQQLVMGN